MKFTTRFGCLFILLCIAPAVAAQTIDDFTLQDGNWSYTEFNILDAPNDDTFRLGDEGGRADLSRDGFPASHLYQNWWWYRISDPFGGTIDDREYAFSRQSAGSTSGATAHLEYSPTLGQVDPTLAFAISFDYTLQRVNNDEVNVIINFSGANIGRTLSLDLFAYFDPDLINTPPNDMGTYDALARKIAVNESAIAMDFTASAPGYVGYEIDTFSALRAKLADSSATNLANVGTPYAGGDFTGAFQWHFPLLGNDETFSGQLTKHMVTPEPSAMVIAAIGVCGVLTNRRRPTRLAIAKR